MRAARVWAVSPCCCVGWCWGCESVFGGCLCFFNALVSTPYFPHTTPSNTNKTHKPQTNQSSDPLADLALVTRADVLVGLHGNALFHAFFMPRHSSVVEIRPHQFVGAWPNMYMKVCRVVVCCAFVCCLFFESDAAPSSRSIVCVADGGSRTHPLPSLQNKQTQQKQQNKQPKKDLTSKDDGHAIFWWGVNIAQAEASKPGRLELEGRGSKNTWFRDRHTQVGVLGVRCVVWCRGPCLCAASRILDHRQHFTPATSHKHPP